MIMHYQIRTVLGVIWHKLNELDSMITQYARVELLVTRLTFICSKSTIETIEKGVKYL